MRRTTHKQAADRIRRLPATLPKASTADILRATHCWHLSNRWRDAFDREVGYLAAGRTIPADIDTVDALAARIDRLQSLPTLGPASRRGGAI